MYSQEGRFRLSYFRKKNKNRQQKKEKLTDFIRYVFRIKHLLRRKLSITWRCGHIPAFKHRGLARCGFFYLSFVFRI
jgi:hypothetical protein